jgi:hypothetical protein
MTDLGGDQSESGESNVLEKDLYLSDTTESERSEKENRHFENLRKQAASNSSTKRERTENEKKIKERKERIVEGPIFEKRMMMYLADLSKIVGPSSDRFFNRTENEVKRLVKPLNHATRYYLGLKFWRRNEIDFEKGFEIDIGFSKVKTSRLLGIHEDVFRKFVLKMDKTKRIIDVMEKYGQLSPVEFRPRCKEYYFRDYAKNYEGLKVGGLFRRH